MGTLVLVHKSPSLGTYLTTSSPTNSDLEPTYSARSSAKSCKRAYDSVAGQSERTKSRFDTGFSAVVLTVVAGSTIMKFFTTACRDGRERSTFFQRIFSSFRPTPGQFSPPP